MRKYTLISILLLGVAVLLSVAFVYQTNEPVLTSSNTEEMATSSLPVPEPEVVPIISLAEKIGQLFIIGHWADTQIASTTELINKYHLGGVVIMSAPEDPTEIKSWTNIWNEVSSQPLFIAIDQEGGPASRLKGPAFTETGQRNLTSTTTAYEIGKIRSAELRTLGINMNFSPVLDTAENPDSFMYERAFPSKASSSALAAAMIDGMEKESVIGVVKHFPGHDDTVDDSHHTLPVVNIERFELDTFASQFSELIRDNQPSLIMTAHVLFPNIDDTPASLSSFFLTDYLKNDIGFTGLILTDDMSMEAITINLTSEEASVKALQAGSDMILFAAKPEQVGSAISAVIAAAEKDEFLENHISESYQQVIKLKQTIK